MKCKSVLLLLAWLAGTAGCNGNDSQELTAGLEQVDPSGQQVKFWYQHTLEREEMLKKLIEEFNRGNPHGIQVQGEYAGTYRDIYNKMVVGLQSGLVPELVVAYNNQAYAYYQNQGVVDLLPYMRSPRWGLTPEEQEDFYPAFLEQDQYSGVQVAFPPNRSMELLYYNADWLNELGYWQPPSTWEEFAQVCRQAKEQPFSRNPRKRRSLGFLLDADASQLAALAFSRGGDFMDAERRAYTLNTPQVRAALEQLLELKREGAMELIAEQGQAINEFSVGQVLFFTLSSTGLPFAESGVEAGLKFAWEVAALPHAGERPAMNVYGASVAVCRTAPEKQLAAWLFVKWFTQPEQQARWVEASGYFPVRRSTAARLEEYFAQHPRYATAYGLLEFGRSEPGVLGYERVRRSIAETVFRIFAGEDLEQALAQLEREANRTLEER
jgi:multiple sugar transport system substrate-binding protein/sn-glycerol 3-phosphate transport system substrate-binding protein